MDLLTKTYNAVLRQMDKNKGKSSILGKLSIQGKNIMLNKNILSFAKSLSTVSAFKMVSFMISLAVAVIIARTLGAEATGTIGVVQTAVNFLIIPMVMGVSISASKYMPSAGVSEKRIIMGTAFLINLLLAAVFSSVYLLISPIMTNTFKLVEEDIWRYSIIIAVIVNFGFILDGFMRGNKSFYKIGLYRFISLAVFLVLIVFMVSFNSKFNIHSYMSIVCIYQLLFAILAFFHLHIIPARFSLKYAVKLYQYGIINMLSWALTIIISGIDIFIVKYFCPANDVGIFSAYVINAKAIFNVLFYEMFLVVFQPTIADMDKKSLIKRLDKWTFVLFPVFTVGSSIMITLIIMLFGSEFPLKAVYILFTALGMSLSGICQLYSAIISMEGNNGARLWLFSIGMCTPALILIQYFAIRSNGVYGGILSYSVINLLLFIFFRLMIKYRFNESAISQGG